MCKFNAFEIIKKAHLQKHQKKKYKFNAFEIIRKKSTSSMPSKSFEKKVQVQCLRNHQKEKYKFNAFEIIRSNYYLKEDNAVLNFSSFALDGCNVLRFSKAPDNVIVTAVSLVALWQKRKKMK